MSRPKTPWAVLCRDYPVEGKKGCGQVFLTREEYAYQMTRPDSTWRCPNCGDEAYWDDDNYEEHCEQG